MSTTRFRPPAVPAEELARLRSRIAELRTAAELSPEGLSAAAGLSRSAVRLIESGDTETPSLGALYAIAAALRCEVADLFAGPKKNSRKS